LDFRNEDLRDPLACERCRDVEVVFHLASKVGAIGYYLARPAEVLFDNLQIDANILKASMKAGVARYMYAGSAHIYPIELQGSPDAPLIHEHQDIPAHPELSYGWAKLIGEKQIEYAIAQGTDHRASIVRIIGAYGPSQDVDRALEYPERKPYRLLGTGVEPVPTVT
jgi:nucleoside-diphosphate-sugar epimerase